jgi:hypothetical protein
MRAQHVMRGVVLALASLLGASCADLDTPTGVAGPQYATGGAPDVTHIARYANGAPQITIAWAMAWIGPEGGSLRLLDFEVIVPPGAVKAVTRFSIRLPVDPHQATYAMAEFLPHGVTFAQPVTLRLPHRGTTAEHTSARVLWWSGSSWVPFETEEVDGRLQTTTTHFSTYGTEDPERGIIPLGG